MAILRASEVREKDDTELDADLVELRKSMMKIRGGLASGGIPEDVGKLREIKKTIARILTIRHERKLGLKRGSTHQPAVKEAKETEAKAEAPKVEHKAKEVHKKEAPKKTKAKKTSEVSKKK